VDLALPTFNVIFQNQYGIYLRVMKADRAYIKLGLDQLETPSLYTRWVSAGFSSQEEDYFQFQYYLKSLDYFPEYFTLHGNGLPEVS
jgi:hypothetical protein